MVQPELTLFLTFKWVALFSLNQNYCLLSFHYQGIYEEGQRIDVNLSTYITENSHHLSYYIVILKLYTKNNKESSSFCVSYLHHKKSTYVIESD